MKHVKHLQPRGRTTAVKIVCTCGESHGLASFRNPDSALRSGLLPPASVGQWTRHMGVSDLSRELGARDDVREIVATAWAAR